MTAAHSVSSTGDGTYLAIDIGGTKTALALYRSETEQPARPLAEKRYSSADYGGIEEIIKHFLAGLDFRPGSVIVGIAGVVGESRARVTNLPWIVTKQGLHELGFTAVCMINDMTALAASLPLLGREDLLCLQEASTDDIPFSQTTAVLAPGTGLGEGFLFQTDDESVPRGTEGGHCAFGPAGSEQQELLSWLVARGHEGISYEAVCAGPAIGLLYDFYAARGEAGDPRVRRELDRAADRTPVVVRAAVAGTCPVCRKAVDLFLSLLGREGANLVLKVYATRGLFLGGGILPRLAGKVSFEPFLASFRQDGPMTGLLRSVPVQLIVRRDAVLLGVAGHGRAFLRKVTARGQ